MRLIHPYEMNSEERRGRGEGEERVCEGGDEGRKGGKERGGEERRGYVEEVRGEEMKGEEGRGDERVC